MEPLEAWENLRNAFTAGLFNGEVNEFKFEDWLEMGAIRMEKNSGQDKNLRRELVVESWEEARIIPAFLGLCLRSLGHGSIPIWEQ